MHRLMGAILFIVVPNYSVQAMGRCDLLSTIHSFSEPLVKKIAGEKAVELTLLGTPIEILTLLQTENRRQIELIERDPKAYNVEALKEQNLKSVQISEKLFNEIQNGRRGLKVQEFKFNGRLIVRTFRQTVEVHPEYRDEDGEWPAAYIDNHFVRFSDLPTHEELVTLNSKIDDAIKNLATIKDNDPSAYKVLTNEFRNGLLDRVKNERKEIQAREISAMQARLADFLKTQQELRVAELDEMRRLESENNAILTAENQRLIASAKAILARFTAESKNSLVSFLSALRRTEKLMGKPISKQILENEISKLNVTIDVLEPNFTDFDSGNKEAVLFGSSSSTSAYGESKIILDRLKREAEENFNSAYGPNVSPQMKEVIKILEQYSPEIVASALLAIP